MGLILGGDLIVKMKKATQKVDRRKWKRVCLYK